jgi:hypothetical protein
LFTPLLVLSTGLVNEDVQVEVVGGVGEVNVTIPVGFFYNNVTNTEENPVPYCAITGVVIYINEDKYHNKVHDWARNNSIRGADNHSPSRQMRVEFRIGE